MKEVSTICQHCSRPLGHTETTLLFEQMHVCKDCYVMLTAKMRVGRQKNSYCPYSWLRVPALMIALIGVIGLLITKVGLFSALLRFIHKPPLMTCYGVIAGAVILFGISLIRMQMHEKKLSIMDSAMHKNWRSF